MPCVLVNSSFGENIYSRLKHCQTRCQPKSRANDVAHDQTHSRLSRGESSTGAVGEFAPIDFQQGLHCSRPDEKLS